jgi:phosphoribosylglycinamide formyltransferase-1
MKNIVILISGGGSNMQALVECVAQNRWAEQGIARVAAVVSNRADVGGLAYAASKGIETAVLSHQLFEGRAQFDAALMALIDGFKPDLVLLAGFMRILTPAFTQHYAGKMLNIHPSILPSFTGLHTHEAALAAGVKVHGATVHGVTAQLDFGPIVVQSCVAVLPQDTAETLAKRVLATEHFIYPQALTWWVDGRMIWRDGGIEILNPAGAQTASQTYFAPI